MTTQTTINACGNHSEKKTQFTVDSYNKKKEQPPAYRTTSSSSEHAYDDAHTAFSQLTPVEEGIRG
jgi:hypothetical protein